jgi:hypothetical protein
MTRLSVRPPDEYRDNVFWRQASASQFKYSVLGLILGLICVIGGVVLFVHGVIGATSWTTKIVGAVSNISDAGPGAVLFVVGLFVVWITRFDIRANRH